MSKPLTVAWFTYFPVEWLENLPAELATLPRMHPATWQRVLLSEFQKDPGLRIHVVVLRKHFPRTLSFEQGNATFHCIKVPGGLRAPSLFWLDTWSVSRVLRRIQPDMVHAWGTENGAATVAARLRYPSLVTLQGLMTWMEELGVANSYQRFAARFERRSLRRLRHVTAESSFSVRHLRDRYPNLRVQQIEHAPQRMFHEAARHPSLNPVRLLSISTLGHAKGTDVLLEALDPMCDELNFELVLVGGAPAEVLEGYRRRFSPRLWSRLKFLNHLTSAQVLEEMSKAAVMIYPTRADNSPNAVKESIAAGLPVVASEVGGIVDYVHPDRNGFLFPVGSVDGCRDAIRRWAVHPGLGRGVVDAATLARGRDYLSPETMGRRFREAYREVVADRF